MRDALILLLSCFLCYPKLLAQQLPGTVKGTVGNSLVSAPWNQAGKAAVRVLRPRTARITLGTCEPSR
jgi:hypothetical protein